MEANFKTCGLVRLCTVKRKPWNSREERREKVKTDPRRRIFKWWFVVGKFNETTTDMREYKLLARRPLTKRYCHLKFSFYPKGHVAMLRRKLVQWAL